MLFSLILKRFLKEFAGAKKVLVRNNYLALATQAAHRAPMPSASETWRRYEPQWTQVFQVEVLTMLIMVFPIS